MGKRPSYRALLILASLADTDRHGYAIKKDIVDRSSGAVRLGSTTLYRLLGQLLDDHLIEEAAARPWFASIMLRELVAGAPHFDAHTFQLMNDVFAAVRDVLAQGQREGVFRQVDPLLTHLTIMPPILIFFVRQRVIATARLTKDLAEPRQVEEFARHMQASVRGMLRKDS